MTAVKREAYRPLVHMHCTNGCPNTLVFQAGDAVRCGGCGWYFSAETPGSGYWGSPCLAPGFDPESVREIAAGDFPCAGHGPPPPAPVIPARQLDSSLFGAPAAPQSSPTPSASAPTVTVAVRHENDRSAEITNLLNGFDRF